MAGEAREGLQSWQKLLEAHGFDLILFSANTDSTQTGLRKRRGGERPVLMYNSITGNAGVLCTEAV